jgi:processive 1,2-diacylglycerol beta-glucosyltransferase
MRLQFVVQQKSGIAYHRLVTPMEFMQWDETDSSEMLWIVNDEHKIDGDILLYSKFIWTTPDQLKAIKAKGTKIVVDVDDSWDLPPLHPFYDVWKQRENAQKVIENIKIADLVICTTLKLQDKIRQYNKNTVVIPNALPFGYENYVPKPIAHEKMTFIYVGGSSHLLDIEMLKGKFKKIGGEPFIKNNAEFVLAGYEATSVPRYLSKEDFDNKKPTMVPVRDVWEKMTSIFAETRSYRILPSTDLEKYIDYYDQADVALIPLVNSDWNNHKSELKIIEAGCKGIPVICSKVLPYSTLYGKEGIMWVETPDDWIKHIRYCVKNPNFVKDMGQKMSEWVKEEYDLLKWNNVRKEVFKNLLK